ncbi:MAG TPA: hypothetical protein VG435_03725 [Acidimicrobiales bacterium]|nr:hypothetical protein [Acidimicrobiales bacterium]
MGDVTCDEVNDAAAGFALDILEPTKRASIAAHLIRCGACRATVTRTQDSAAELLDLAGGGGIQGPLPWDDRSWNDSPWDESDWTAHRSGHEGRPTRRRFRMVMTMAAAAVLLVGTTFGPELEQAARPSNHPVASAVLLADDQPVGTVKVFAGNPPVIEIEAQHLPASGRITCEMVGGDGRLVVIGSFKVFRGEASWAGRAASEPPAEMLLLDQGGVVVASASVPG